MQSLLVSHTQRYHRHYGSGGHIWQGRFKSPVIQNDEHLLTVLRYIEANPLRTALVQRAEEYLWSSYRMHGLGESAALPGYLRPGGGAGALPSAHGHRSLRSAKTARKAWKSAGL